MAIALYTNNATATLSSSITAASTSVTVTSGQGALFPSAVTGGDYFYGTLISSTGTIEIVKVTNKTSDTFTIVRAQDGTTASAFASGSKFELRVVAAGLNEKLAKDGGTATNITINSGTITGITDLAVADGGTGSSTASGARTNLGLGTISTQNANSVAITGGSVTGITDLAVADGGTGASTASAARTNLGVAIGTDVQAYSANLTSWSGKTAPSGAAVGTTDTQTLTNKTISSPNFDNAPVPTVVGSAPIFFARAYGTFSASASGASITSGANFGSVTRYSIGNFYVTFTTAMPDTNYVVVTNYNYSGGSYLSDGNATVHSKSTTGFYIKVMHGGGDLIDPGMTMFVVIR